MIIRILVFLMFPVLGFSQIKPMTNAEISSFKTAIEQFSQSTQTLSSDFVQTKYLSFLNKPIESKGTLSFKKPDRVLWKYTSPFMYSVIFKDKKIYINDAGKKSDIGNAKLFDKLNSLIVGSVSGNMFDAKEFDISFFTSKGKPLVKLKTKDASLKKYLKQIELTFEDNKVAEVKMIEPSDDYTQIIFTNSIRNAKIDNAVFIP